MSGENSCFSRFLVKFVEVSAAGLATAISAYALAHLGGLLSSSPTSPSAPATAVQVSPIATNSSVPRRFDRRWSRDRSFGCGHSGTDRASLDLKALLA